MLSIGKNPKVAFIVVCYNNVDLLKQCFDSINKQTYKNHFTVMIDNGSKDKSVEFTRRNFPDVKLIDSGFNNGFARGNNIAIKQAFEDKGVEYVVLLNSDATLDKNWLTEMISFASLRPKAALMQGMTLDFYDHDIVDSTHIFLSKAGIGTQQNWRNKRVKVNMNFKKVMGVNAAAAMFSRKFLEAQPFDQYFDESFFMYLEDVDISLRATVMGWDNYFVKDAIAYHMGSASSGKNPGYSMRMTFRNNLAVIIKNIPTMMAIRLILKLPKVDFIYIRELIRKGRKSEIKYLVKGRAQSLVRVPLYLAKRRKLSQHKNISSEYLWQLMDSGK